jgi:phospholipid/cholesterol/gamma-HCH transport system substrate-binding protein
MALCAMAILAVLIWLITSPGALFSNPATLYTYVPDSFAMAKGAPVRLNGILVGSISAIELSGSRDPRRMVRIVMAVSRDRLSQIPEDSITKMGQENALGTWFINIRIGRSQQAVSPGGELRSQDTTDFQDIIESSNVALASLQDLEKRVDTILSQVENGKGSIGKFLVDTEFYDRAVATVAQMQKIAETVGSGRGTIGKLLYDDTLINSAQASINRLDTVIQGLQEGKGSAGKFLQDPEVYNQARDAIAGLRRAIDDLNAGKGTAGKVLKDEALYRQFLATLDKVDTTIDKVDTTIDKVNSGEGTIGQLMANPQLYQNLNGFTTELNSLVKDIHANPKKFLRIKLGIF